MSDRITEITDFLLQLDALKSVNRKNYINAGERLENSAEHSWHLAMACWAFADLLPDDYDVPKLIQLALVHDLGEIEAGDTFLYSDNRDTAHIAERESVTEIASDPGNPIENMLELWDEQETGNSKEAKLLKVIDRLLPFLHNISSEGGAWKDHGIKRHQVLDMHRFIEDENPEIFAWLLEKLDNAVEQGWLKES